MRYTFAGCLLDTAARSLTRDGAAVATEPQVFDLLQLLLSRAGNVVDRDTIVGEVWGGRIVSDSAISARIAAARKAVGDNGARQAVIRTLPRRGLILATEVAVEGAAEAPPVATPDTLPLSQPVQRIRYTRGAEGHPLAFAVTGDGPPVVRLAPPLMTDLEAEWNLPAERRFIDALSARLRLVRFDYLGSGQSDRSRVETDFAAQAAQARAAAAAAGFERFAVLAESGGALPALHLAALFPEAVERLAIVGGYAEGRLVRAGAEAGPDPLRALVTSNWGEPQNVFVTALMTSYFPEGPLDVARDWARLIQGALSKEAELAIRDAINAASVVPLLGRVRCPTLIVHSRHDGVHPLAQAQKLAAGISGAELVVLETANHIPFYGNEVWDEFVRTLLDFLDP